MDAFDLLILALRLVMVALLYAFLVLVLRTAAGGLQRTATHSARTGLAPLRLVVLEPGASSLRPGQIVNVAETTTVGRSERADLVVADPSVSAEHVRLSRLGSAWAVADLGSTNGTRLNDAPVKGKASLADGDVLALGMVRLQVGTH